MSKPRYPKRDANHAEIVRHLEKYGVTVIDLSSHGSMPDLLCLYGANAAFIEIKSGKAAARYTAAQVLWISATPWPVRFIETKDDALLFATTLRGALTGTEKDRLAAMIYKGGEKLYTPKQVQDALKGNI